MSDDDIKCPCPHARLSWRMCPHCLGVNSPLVSEDSPEMSCLRRLNDGWEADLSNVQPDHWLLTGRDVSGNWTTEGYEPMTEAESALMRSLNEFKSWGESK